jgi:hypothetical protein
LGGAGEESRSVASIGGDGSDGVDEGAGGKRGAGGGASEETNLVSVADAGPRLER